MSEKPIEDQKEIENHENEATSEVATFVETPYVDPISEIRTAQSNDEPLDLDSELEPEADPIDMTSLAAAFREEEERQETELEAIAGENEEEAQARLAKEIAEDEALEQEAQELTEADEEVDAELAAALPQAPQADEEGNLDLQEMESCIETLLFLSDRPLSAKKLQEMLGPEMDLSLFEQAVRSLQTRFQASCHGIELIEVAGGFQFRTKPGRAALAKKLAKVQTQRLSTGAMETLAIVAYRQPVLKDDIDKIRGVDSSHFIRGLLDKKLIRMAGRSELPGRPIQYATSQEFLELFGLSDLSALPSLRELEQMVPGSQTKSPEDEDPRLKEMRRLVGEMKTDKSGALNYDPKEDEQILREIRERVKSIPTSTPYLEAQDAAEAALEEAQENSPEGPTSLL